MISGSVWVVRLPAVQLCQSAATRLGSEQNQQLLGSLSYCSHITDSEPPFHFGTPLAHNVMGGNTYSMRDFGFRLSVPPHLSPKATHRVFSFPLPRKSDTRFFKAQCDGFFSQSASAYERSGAYGAASSS
ncbi:MAG: hypothetical protein RL326_768 [Pseudomonadota bacterium]